MTIFEIDTQITDLIDPETGEILDFDAFENLQMEREVKLENMILWVKDLEATASAIKAEADKLNERKKAAEKKADSLKKYINLILEGQKFSTPKVAVSFRKSKSVEIDPLFLEWATNDLEAGFEFLRMKDPEVDKAAVKAALKEGREFEYARLIENVSMTIK